MSNISPLNLVRVSVDTAQAEDVEIAPAVAGRSVVLAGGWLITDSANAVGFKDSDGNSLAGDSGFGDNGGFVLPVCELGYLTAPLGKGLVLTNGDAIQLSGCLSVYYV